MDLSETCCKDLNWTALADDGANVRGFVVVYSEIKCYGPFCIGNGKHKADRLIDPIVLTLSASGERMMG